MIKNLKVYNSLSKTKEAFKPLNKKFIGMYVCGPTVYNQVHIGNCRTFVFFDIVYRYFLSLGYKVRYVRNITDVGHLEDLSLTDKISEQAKLEKLEPMEISHKYTLMFRQTLALLNVLPPSIEPLASGHILEQIEFIKEILAKGFAYENNGSVYFDLEKYAQSFNYGVLNNRKLEDLLNNTRDLQGQGEKKGKLDFALWIKAKPEHIMKWNSPWSIGFPGWHIECSAMSRKYLGATFDMHGGGLDLMGTHHSNEIAQTQAATNSKPCNYWLHTNMLTLNGTKMSKSLNNVILPGDIFTGKHQSLSTQYAPMTLRLLFLQAHYRSQLDISNTALQAAEKAYNKLNATSCKLASLKPKAKSSFSVDDIEKKAFSAINDDFNTSMVLAVMFDITHKVNLIHKGIESLIQEDLKKLEQLFITFTNDILGLKVNNRKTGIEDNLLHMIMNLRAEAKKGKNWKTSDHIRTELNKLGIQIKDNADGTCQWDI